MSPEVPRNTVGWFRISQAPLEGLNTEMSVVLLPSKSAGGCLGGGGALGVMVRVRDDPADAVTPPPVEVAEMKPTISVWIPTKSARASNVGSLTMFRVKSKMHESIPPPAGPRVT